MTLYKYIKGESREAFLEFQNAALTYCFRVKVKPGSFTTNHEVMSQAG